MTAARLNPVQRWYCPACRFEDVTTGGAAAQPNAVRFHTCPKFGMISAPMVRQGVKAKLEVNTIEGYVGRELVQYDANGRPIMNAVITRDEGTDVAVYAPTATAKLHDLADEAGVPVPKL